MRLGVYGGSFDPVHVGHLLLAETARVGCKLDRVDFVPLGAPPHLKNVRTSGELRYSMLKSALADYPEFRVERFEIDSPKTSYTVDTLRHYRAVYPEAELFLILSSETFNDLPNWKSTREICELASIVVARRAGYSAPDFDALSAFVSPERLDEYRSQVVAMPLIEASSSSIRQRIAAGESVRFLVPDSAIECIRSNRLYQK